MEAKLNTQRIFKPLIAGLAVIAISACTNPKIETAQHLDIQGQGAAAEAAREYKRLAHFENHVMWDKASAIAFSEKAIAAANGEPLATPTGSASANSEIAAAYQALNAMRAQGGDQIAPKATGQAIARLDCWNEQSSEGFQPLDIAFCKDGFREYVTETATALKAAGKDISGIVPDLKSFHVTFPLGSTMPAVGSNTTLDEAAAFVARYKNMRIVLGGHADKSGSRAINQRLSQARADRVAGMLRARGVAEAQISTIGFGETYPRIVTPDGQRSKGNRRVEIVIGPDKLL